MKYLSIVLIIVISAFMTDSILAQQLEKGNLVCVNRMDVKLKEGVTHAKFEDFMLNKYFPVFEQNMKGVTLHLLKGVRGDIKGEYAIMIYFKDVATRDKYFPEEDVVSKSGKECLEKLIPLENELYKIAETDFVMKQWEIL